MGKQLIPLWALAQYGHHPSTHASAGIWNDPALSRYRSLSCADPRSFARNCDAPE